MKKAERNANVELLRIFSMLTIVAHHYAAFGFYAEELAFSRNKIFVDIFGMAGHVGVDLFVLISAYFMATARFRLKKLLMLMGNVWFYSLGITAVFLLTGLAAPGREVLKQAVFPLLTSCYWFASYYVLLMLFSPFLNAMTARLDRRSHGALCLLCVALCMLLPEFLHLRFADGLLPMFLTLYLCGAWCRFYVPAEKRIGDRCLVLALLVLAAAAVKVGVSDALAARAGDLQRLVDSLAFLDVYSPFAFAAAILLLLAACCRPAADRPLVSRLGGLTFGVYLLHANPLFSAVIWQRPFRTASFVDSPLLFLHAFGTVAILFAAGSLIDLLRQAGPERLWARGVDALLARWDRRPRPGRGDADPRP